MIGVEDVVVNNPHCISFIKFIIVEVTVKKEKGKLKRKTKKINEVLLLFYLLESC